MPEIHYCTLTVSRLYTWLPYIVIFDNIKTFVIIIITSIEALLWRASLLRRAQATGLRRRWFDDSAAANALSMNLFAPMANPVNDGAQVDDGAYGGW